MDYQTLDFSQINKNCKVDPLFNVFLQNRFRSLTIPSIMYFRLNEILAEDWRKNIIITRPR